MGNENLPTPRGRNILGFRTAGTTTTRGRTPIDTYPPTVEIPIVSDRVLVPDAPTIAPSIPRPEVKAEPKPQKIGTKARIALAGLAAMGAVETTGAVITEQTNNQPMNAQTVKADLAWPWNLGKSAVEDIQGLLGNKTPSSEASINIKGVKPFNPNISTEDAQKVQIGTYTRPITEEEKQSFRSTPPVLKILPGELQPRTTIMLPGDNLQPGDVVRVEKNYNSNVLSQITHKQENTMMGYDLTYNRPDITISLSFIPGIDKAKGIKVYQDKPWTVNGKDYFTGIYAVITMPDGTRLGTSIGALVDVRDIKSLIENLPILDSDPESNLALREGRYNKPGLEVTPETPLVATARSNAVISVGFGGRSIINTPGLREFAFDSALKTDGSGNLLLNQK